MQSWLPKKLKNVFSQFGEDSILEAIFNEIPMNESGIRTCVEFGAWDGLHLSNSANLVKNHNWHGVFIESDKNRFEELSQNYKSDDVSCIQAMVNFEGDNSLDQILARTTSPVDLDLISIDIDGCDYWILESIKIYLPKVFIVEFNPTISNSVDYVQPRNLHISQGSSLKAITRLGKEKGYELIATTLTNAFLVKHELASRFLTTEKSIDDFYKSKYQNSIWTSYDGTIMLETDLVMPWQNLKVNQSKLQVLPGALRTFPDSYNFFQKVLFSVNKKWKRIQSLWSTDEF